MNSARSPISQLVIWNLWILSYKTDGGYKEGKIGKRTINYRDRECCHRKKARARIGSNVTARRIYTEETLTKRFNNVQKTCQCIVVFNEELGFTLFLPVKVILKKKQYCQKVYNRV